MKIKLLTGILLLGSTLALRGQQDFAPGAITPFITCRQDTSQHYSLFLPSGYSEERKWPVVFLFEPAARALLPVEKYHPLAERFGYVLCCSYNSRNGPNEPIFAAANAMYSDAFERFSLDEARVCLAGFSGGARIACLIALTNPNVDAVIGCGAGFPFSQLPEEPISFDYCGITGITDMNFTEMILLDSALQNFGGNNLFLTFPGGHRWPDSTAFQPAFFWLETCAMRAGKETVNGDLTDEITRYYSAEIARYESENTPIDLSRSLRNLVILLEGLADVSYYKEQLDLLMRSEHFAQACQLQWESRTIERKLQKKYIDEFEQISLLTLDPDYPEKPRSWWKKEFLMIDELQDPGLRARLREFLTNGSWEQHFNSCREKRYTAALAYLDVYEAGFPADPKPAYYKSLVCAMSGDEPSLYRYLAKAREKGLEDPGWITGEEAFHPYLEQKKMQKFLVNLNNN